MSRPRTVGNDKTAKGYRYDFGIYRGWLRESGIPAFLGTIDKRHLIRRRPRPRHR